MRRLTVRLVMILLGVATALSVRPITLSAFAQQSGFSGPGRYRIEVVAAGKALDVNSNDKRTVQQWTTHDGNNQQWYIEETGDGHYTFRSVEYGKFLEIADGRSRDGSIVVLADKREHDNQKWKISDFGNGQYTIIAKAGRSLEAPPGRREDGVRLQVANPTALENQRFRLTRLGDLEVAGRVRPRDGMPSRTPGGSTTPAAPAPPDPARFTGPARYSIQNLASGKVLDLRREDGETVQQWTNGYTLNQQWDVVDAGGGYFYIRSAENGKALEVIERRPVDGTAVVARARGVNDSQKWRIVDRGDGQFSIISRLGKALDLPYNSPDDGRALHVWTEHQEPNQRFRFTRADAEVYTGGRVRGAAPPPVTAPPVPPPDSGPVVPGSMRWRGRVDIEVLLDVRGATVTERTVGGQSFNNGRFTFTNALPARSANLRIDNRKVRGSVELVAQPTAENNWTATIRIRDPRKDAVDYEFDLYWQ